MIQIQSIKERGYVKFYITSLHFKGRVKKHIGKGEIEEFDGFKIQLTSDLDSYFLRENVTKDIVLAFVDDAVRKLKFGISIFDYVEEFIEKKTNTINRLTNKPLSRSAINSYLRAIELFKRMLIEKRLRPIPEIICEQLLNEFMTFRKRLSYNYMVKLHTRLKSFIMYLEYRNLPVDKTYHYSNFSEQYDNQEPDNQDRALTLGEMEKLHVLRLRFKNNMVDFPCYKKAKTLSQKLQSEQRKTRIKNVERTLDCFLFMASTGMYVADIDKSSLMVKQGVKNPHLKFRRTKNNSLCKAIPLCDYGVFNGKTLFNEYGIKAGGNFPLNLTVNTFNKHLKTISKEADLGFELKSKMARKTFATINYFNYGISINNIQIMLGHKDVKTTMHYLRIDDDDLATQIQNQIKLAE